MWLTGGSIAVSDRAGAVSPDYRVFRLGSDVEPRFLHHLLRSAPYVEQYRLFARADTTFDRRIQQGDIDNLALAVPPLEEQRRIADFLDDHVSRVDAVVAARARQAALADVAFECVVLDAIRGRDVDGGTRPSGLRWLGPVPASWSVLPVSSQFDTVLGKMLDERQQTGTHPLPYLRNTNVQWDRIDTDDLKIMDIAPSEYGRCTIRAGDLLICEGGQPGRAAIWDGSVVLMGFQKALHRARSRGRSEPRWLLHCLRAAVAINAFAGENGVTTIGHLTGEQLRAQRFPFPEPEVQRRLVAEIDGAMAERDRLKAALARSATLLTEYKQSLTTAAVTGQFDVTTASTRSVPA